MRLVTYQSTRGSRAAVETCVGLVDLNSADSSIPFCMKKILAGGKGMMDRIRAASTRGVLINPAKVRLLPPVLSPEKIVAVGLNYADHAAETGATVGDEPVIFNKFPTTLSAHEQDVELPTISDQVDYEAELVIVIGTGGRNIPREEALDAVAGYTCGQDVSVRDWQKGKPAGQWLLGKTFDGCGPVGPAIVTKDEIEDISNLRIQLRLNGETMQDSNTDQLIFPIDYLVWYLSQVFTLKPGDLIFTGTPPGVGDARDPKVFIKADDVTEVDIEKIGILRNKFVAVQSQ